MLNAIARQRMTHFAFQGVPVEVVEHDGELWVPGEEIGRALGYADPRKAIKTLYERNREELEQYSVVLKVPVVGSEAWAPALNGDDDQAGNEGLRPQSEAAGGGKRLRPEASGVIQRRSVRCYNRDGASTVTMLSSQPKAAQFRGWLLKIMNAYTRGELALAGGDRESLLITCIKEARYGNPVAVHTLIERFGYPESIKREIRSDLQRRAFRDPAQPPELVDWFLGDLLPRLREEIEGEAGPLLGAIRARPPSLSAWKELDDPQARWALRHRPTDLYTFVVPIAEAEGIDVDVTSNRFTRWIAYSAAKLKAGGWDRVEHSRSHGWETYRLRLLKAGG